MIVGRALVLAVLAASLVGVGVARAATTTQRTVTRTVTETTTAAAEQSSAASTAAATTATTPGTPVLVTDKRKPPTGYRLDALQVLAIAARDPRVRAELRKHPRLEPYEYTKGAPQWQVSWFTRGKPQRELLQVYVDDNTHRVTQAWTGYQVAWSMARGYPGAFGRVVNAWYIWVPLCLLFVAPFVGWPLRRPTLLHLDLLMLLGFSASLALFNHAEIGLSVPLVYPFLLYLLVRLVALGLGRGVPREPLRTLVPVPWLAVGIVFLMAFRIALNVLDSNVIDVGYSGVIGADKLIHGHALYGHWPADNMFGDTYGPVSYYLYVPFRLIFGWSGTWDTLPAAHAAAIFFDVATLVALFALGRRLKSVNLGIVLAYAWAAYPFTLFTLSSNTNDSLVALLVTLSLLVVTSAPARGVAAGLAGLTKFAPFVLAPLLLRGVGERPRGQLLPPWREIAGYAWGFVAAIFVCMLPVLLGNDLHAFWHDSVSYQSGRDTPFSIWGLWGGLAALQHLIQGLVIAGALVVAVLPRRRGPVQVAALAGALIVALQLTLNYWLYPYIVWFFPLAAVALFASYPEPGEQLVVAWRSLEDRRAEGSPDGDPAPDAAPPAPEASPPAPTWLRPPAAD